MTGENLVEDRRYVEIKIMRKIFLGILVVAAVGGIGWYGWIKSSQSNAQKPGAGTQAAVISVEAVHPTQETVSQKITALGTLHSNESVTVRPEIAGRVTEILFKEGQKVRKGQPLIKLDDAIYAAQLEQAEANLALSVANDERASKLYKQGAGTERSKDEAESKRRVDLAAVNLAQATLEKMTLTAPFDGIIGLRAVSIGAYVIPGQDIANLEDIDSLKLNFRISEQYLPQVSVGMNVAIIIDAYKGRVFAGEIYAIDPLIDESGRAIVIRARLDNSEGLLRPGLFARLTINVDEVADAIMLPEEALVPSGDDLGVFRVTDGKAEWVSVKTGWRQNGRVQITEGIDLSDVIVTEGQMKLRSGVPVNVITAGLSKATTEAKKP